MALSFLTRLCYKTFFRCHRPADRLVQIAHKSELPCPGKVANSTVGEKNIVLDSSNGSNFMAKPLFCDLALRTRVYMFN